MSMSYILLPLLITPAGGPTAESGQPRLCNIGLRGSVHLAYKPYGDPVFGSDGLTCASIKPAAKVRGQTAPSSEARRKLSMRPARTFNNSGETGP